MATTCSTPVPMFSYIYVMLFLNFEFAEETSRIDVWTIVNGRLKFNEVWSDRLVLSKNSLHKFS